MLSGGSLFRLCVVEFAQICYMGVDSYRFVAADTSDDFKNCAFVDLHGASNLCVNYDM